MAYEWLQIVLSSNFVNEAVTKKAALFNQTKNLVFAFYKRKYVLLIIYVLIGHHDWFDIFYIRSWLGQDIGTGLKVRLKCCVLLDKFTILLQCRLDNFFKVFLGLEVFLNVKRIRSVIKYNAPSTADIDGQITLDAIDNELTVISHDFIIT